MIGWIVAGAAFLLLLAFIVLNIWNASKARSARHARDNWERNYEIATKAYDGIKDMWDKREQEHRDEVGMLRLKLAEALSPARTVPLEAVDALPEKPKRASRTKRTGNGSES